MRQREEEKYRVYLQQMAKQQKDRAGERESKCVSLSMHRDENRRQEIKELKDRACAEVRKASRQLRRIGPVGAWVE